MTKVEVRHDEERGVYDLGFTEGDTFIALQTFPASDVQGRIAAAEQYAKDNPAPASATE